MNRTEAIIILEGFKDNPLFNSTHAQALEMAIASLKTDEAYQLEYENRDFVEIPEGMTNGDVMKILFPNVGTNFSNVIDLNLWWNAPYKKRGE